MNLLNMKIGNRLVVSFGIVLILMLCIGGVGWWGSSHLLSNNHELEIDSEILVTTLQIQVVALNFRRYEKDLFINMTSADKMSEYHKKWQEQMAALGPLFEMLISLVKEPHHQQKIKKMQFDLVDIYGHGFEKVRAAVTSGQITSAGDANKAMGEVKTAFHEFETLIGEMVNDIRKNIKEMEATSTSTAKKIFSAIITVIGIATALMILLTIIITRSISIPLAACIDLLYTIKNGDLTQNVTNELLKKKDEPGDLARAAHDMTISLRNLVGDVSQSSQTLLSASEQLAFVSSQTAKLGDAVTQQTNTMAAAAEEASANTNSVAACMEQASVNLSTVTQSTSEMSTTISEIASNSEKARVISEQAGVHAQQLTLLMQQFSQAAREIGKVTETITEISAQTNLLALNATIEAARAGDAGKGFAVVANEIKELAKQTAAATEDIKGKISGVQNTAGSAMSDIDLISGVISDVNSLVSRMAAAIEEQATITRDVANNINQATTGVRNANEQVAQTATVSHEIAQEISLVSSRVEEIRQGGEQVKASAAEMTALANQLSDMIKRFTR